MARPVAADAEATKARILAAGIYQVSLRGIDGTTIRDIAAEARVSLATVLHYFVSKDSLYGAVVETMDRKLGTLKNALMASATPGQNPTEMLSSMVRQSWCFALEHRVAHRVVLRAVLDHGGMPDERIERFVRPSLDDAEDLLVPLLGVTGLQARLALQTLIMTAARYALCGDNELCLITRAPTITAAHDAIGDHLVDVACSLLLKRSP